MAMLAMVRRGIFMAALNSTTLLATVESGSFHSVLTGSDAGLKTRALFCPSNPRSALPCVNPKVLLLWFPLVPYFQRPLLTRIFKQATVEVISPLYRLTRYLFSTQN